MPIENISKLNSLNEILENFKEHTNKKENFKGDYIIVAKKDQNENLIVGEVGDIDCKRPSKVEKNLSHKESGLMNFMLDADILYVKKF